MMKFNQYKHDTEQMFIIKGEFVIADFRCFAHHSKIEPLPQQIGNLKIIADNLISQETIVSI